MSGHSAKVVIVKVKRQYAGTHDLRGEDGGRVEQLQVTTISPWKR